MDKNKICLNTLMDRAEDLRYYRKVIEEAENKFDIKAYSLGRFDTQRMRKIFESFQLKYEI